MTPTSLENNIIYLAGELTHVLHRALTSSFKKNKIHVTVEQFSILALLFYKNGINQQEISVALNRDKTTIARVISNMERNKLVARVMDKSDSRGKLIHLTTKGKNLQQRAIRHSGELYFRAIKGVSKGALHDTNRTLSAILKNLK